MDILRDVPEAMDEGGPGPAPPPATAATTAATLELFPLPVGVVDDPPPPLLRPEVADPPSVLEMAPVVPGGTA